MKRLALLLLFLLAACGSSAIKPGTVMTNNPAVTIYFPDPVLHSDDATLDRLVASGNQAGCKSSRSQPGTAVLDCKETMFVFSPGGHDKTLLVVSCNGVALGEKCKAEVNKLVETSYKQ